MFRYDKSSSNLDNLEQNMKYETQNLHGKLNTKQLVCKILWPSRSSGLVFNGIIPIFDQV